MNNEDNNEDIKPNAYYYVKGEVLIEVRRRLESLEKETTDKRASGKIREIVKLIPEDPAYAFT